ncbi:hypothetical protein PMIN06_010116 [Paraphaeosphaeria minitans]|uniref:Heterokaryon incompatibility domain-containing protein n=1 Tax=Paraphaeosphaeria minitans TaxID=565426 RepID=A0A9P6KQF8_9PLEO|nr:hypothetical protein PMIN01_05643 [Paraphaeosphaeria minitans]
MTRANAGAFEVSLPLHELSKTFQDALFATETMGFQYIWIDSLCIIPDDLDDWKHEAQVMHNVYRNCACMVSASAFAHGAEGFILNKRRIDPSPLLIHSSDGFSVTYAALQTLHADCLYQESDADGKFTVTIV